MTEEVIIDNENNLVTIINSDELDPNGEPTIVEMTIEEYNEMIGE
jgi:hypothetical protein